MPRGRARAVRLPRGGYAYRGRVVRFGRLPKRERTRFRSVWAKKGAAPRVAKHREAMWIRRQARKDYLAGDLVGARAWWDQRDRSLPAKWYWYHH